MFKTLGKSRDYRLQMAIDEAEEAFEEAQAYEAKGNKVRAEECLQRAVRIESEAAYI